MCSSINYTYAVMLKSLNNYMVEIFNQLHLQEVMILVQNGIFKSCRQLNKLQNIKNRIFVSHINIKQKPGKVK